MAQKLAIIAFLGIPCACVYLISMRLTPRKGILKICERLFIGIAMIYLLNLALSPFSITIAQNPLSSLTTGYLGLPGAVLAFAMQSLR